MNRDVLKNEFFSHEWNRKDYDEYIEIFDFRAGSAKKHKLENASERMSAEELVEEYYSSKGYMVRNIDPGFDLEELPDEVQNKIVANKLEIALKKHSPREVSTEIDTKSVKKGFPDLLVFDMFNNEIRDIFTVEVKEKNDGLRYNQIKWFTLSHKSLKTKIAYIHRK